MSKLIVKGSVNEQFEIKATSNGFVYRSDLKNKYKSLSGNSENIYVDYYVDYKDGIPQSISFTFYDRQNEHNTLKRIGPDFSCYGKGFINKIEKYIQFDEWYIAIPSANYTRWQIQLFPAFTIKISKSEAYTQAYRRDGTKPIQTLRQKNLYETLGVYRYIKVIDGERVVIYIGHGKFLIRFYDRRQNRSEWEFTEIECCIYESKPLAEYWEAELINDFMDMYGRLPKENINPITRRTFPRTQ